MSDRGRGEWGIRGVYLVLIRYFLMVKRNCQTKFGSEVGDENFLQPCSTGRRDHRKSKADQGETEPEVRAERGRTWPGGTQVQ